MATARFYFAPTPCKLGPFTLNSQTVWLQGERFKLSGLDYYMCAIMGSNEFGPASAKKKSKPQWSQQSAVRLPCRSCMARPVH